MRTEGGGRGRTESVRLAREGVVILDQRLLPGEEKYLCLTSAAEMVEAIRNLAVRGAPAIGVAAAFALAHEARRLSGLGQEEFATRLQAAASALRSARPTAVNLAWAVDRVMGRIGLAAGSGPGPRELADLAGQEALAIYRENLEMDLRICRYALELIPPGARILTHCNAGPLATAGYGTALGAIIYAHRQGRGVTVWVDETRPLLQGARLTAWELGRAGVPYRVITDNMAGHFMSRGEVDLVLVGADRIARNGDVANKIGTYSLAVLAHHHGIAFYVAAPRSTLDLTLPSGEHIVIEERADQEVLTVLGQRSTPAEARARNPAFDVTPAALVSAIITDGGILRPPLDRALPQLGARPPDGVGSRSEAGGPVGGPDGKGGMGGPGASEGDQGGPGDQWQTQEGGA
ncbi:MAG: S-methyl-5-thioribose-1-phosphate isomerase [Bacillota bacterium]|nr:S-methyl-5-thioribose-1-phosphate isomerase [Bacillota bacterium]